VASYIVRRKTMQVLKHNPTPHGVAPYAVREHEYILEKKIFCSVFHCCAAVPGANLPVDTFQNHRMRCNTRNLQQGQQLLFAITDKAGVYVEMI
jgi:hypothetical protein